ncbi:hypothetical protein PAXRUDRAFT_179208, partial [Paxillus rubicundulus Ve08.2h10]
IPLCNLFNSDEIGIQLGVSQTSNGEFFLFSSIDKSKYKLNCDKLELVTILKIVCTDGTTTVKPCFLFSGMHHCKDWYTAPDSDDLLHWTTEKICYDWFTKNFIHNAKAHADNSKPIVLDYDGHVSHSTVNIINAEIANNTTLYLLPPPTTHHL